MYPPSLLAPRRIPDRWIPISKYTMLIRFHQLSQARELEWIVVETHAILKDIRHGLQDCYALLAPIDPGSTLVMSTQRNERVKGTVTRVGTRIIKGVSLFFADYLPSLGRLQTCG